MVLSTDKKGIEGHNLTFYNMSTSTGYCSTGNRSTGGCSTGDWSTGDRSTGDWSTGNRSTGGCSTGNWSTGGCSTGDWSTGCWSTGNKSTGDWSTGDRSTGDWSISNYSTGHFSTEDYSGFGCFDKPCTHGEWENAYKPKWLYFRITDWVDVEEMTEEEKESNPSCETTGGYLRVYDYKEAFQKSYNKATREEQLKIKDLPNFDAYKFYQISGIRVDDCSYCPKCGNKLNS